MLEVLLALALQTVGTPAPTTPPAAPPSKPPMVVTIGSPLWKTFPSTARFKRLTKGLNLPPGGSVRVVVRCDVDAGGVLKDCNLWDETPANAEFGKRVLGQMKDFQLVATLPDGRPTAGEVIFVPFKLAAD